MERMSKAAMVTTAAIGAAAALVAVSRMKPAATQQLKSDMKDTLNSMEGVKNEMVNVGQDMTDMARNLKKNMM